MDHFPGHGTSLSCAEDCNAKTLVVKHAAILFANACHANGKDSAMPWTPSKCLLDPPHLEYCTATLSEELHLRTPLFALLSRSQLSVPNTNGILERKARYEFNGMRALIFAGGIPSYDCSCGANELLIYTCVARRPRTRWIRGRLGMVPPPF